MPLQCSIGTRYHPTDSVVPPIESDHQKGTSLDDTQIPVRSTNSLHRRSFPQRLEPTAPQWGNPGYTRLSSNGCCRQAPQWYWLAISVPSNCVWAPKDKSTKFPNRRIEAMSRSIENFDQPSGDRKTMWRPKRQPTTGSPEGPKQISQIQYSRTTQSLVLFPTQAFEITIQFRSETIRYRIAI